MVRTLGFAVCVLVSSSSAVAGDRTAKPFSGTATSQDFDLADVSVNREVAREEACPPEPQRPRNLDTRDFVPPSLTLTLARKGPVLAMGALGARHKDAPRLAHVALSLDF